MTVWSPVFLYDIIDPCAAPSLTVPTQSDPADYFYTGGSPQGEIITVAFIETVNACDIVYTCSTVNGPVGYIDICAYSSLLNTSSFNALTGVWFFNSLHPNTFPEGDWTIRVTGTTGTNDVEVAYHDFTFTMINPCTTVTVNHIATSPYTDIAYSLGDALETLSWDQTIATLSPATSADCGLFSISLFLSTVADPTWNAIDSSWITEDLTNQTVDLPNTVGLPEVGTYNYAYKVYLKDYPTRITATEKDEGHTLEIIDPCLVPTITVPTQTDPLDYYYTGIAAPATY